MPAEGRGASLASSRLAALKRGGKKITGDANLREKAVGQRRRRRRSTATPSKRSGEQKSRARQQTLAAPGAKQQPGRLLVGDAVDKPPTVLHGARRGL